MDEKLIKALKLCFSKSPKEAVNYLKSMNIEISWDWKEQLDIIKRHSFTVAKVMSADILQDIFDEVQKAIEDGTTFNDFKKELTEKLEQKGYSHNNGSAWRLDTIYRTNLQSAYMAGRFYQMKAIETDYPYWQYIAVLDVRTRPNHASIHGKVVKSDDAFWDRAFPPSGYNCRCRTRALDEAYVERRGLKVVSGDSLKSFTPDDGFDGSPAAEYKPDLRKYAPQIRTALKEALAK